MHLVFKWQVNLKKKIITLAWVHVFLHKGIRNLTSCIVCKLTIVFRFITQAIPEDALNDESGEEEDKENPDERISSKFGLALIF